MEKRFEKYLLVPSIAAIVLIPVNILMYYKNVATGFMLTCGLLFYVLLTLAIYFGFRKKYTKKLFHFASTFGDKQKGLLEELDVPFVLLDADGKVTWQSNRFVSFFGTDNDFHKSITSIFSGITKDLLNKVPDEHHMDMTYEDGFFHVVIKRSYMTDELTEKDVENLDEIEFYYAVYFYDETRLQESLQEIEDQKLVCALVYVDNYDEAMASIEEVKRSLLTALIERRINKYFTNIDGIVKKVDKDKYFVLFKRKNLPALEEDRFSLIEDVKTVKIGNEMSVTLSIGVGNSDGTQAQLYEYTSAAIDLALGRGGDQVVVKSAEKISYYGGKTQQVDKSTRVKARVKAQALREIFEIKDQILVMGHPIGDVDSFGASVGIFQAATALGKKAHIVIDDVNTSLRSIKDLYTEANGFPATLFISGEEAKNIIEKNTVVVVVDTNRASYTECPGLLELAKTIVVFDHHRQGTEAIDNAVLSYIEPHASSTCEMISEVLQYFSDNIKLSALEADTLYAGILVDTNNFMMKTGVRTFEAAAYLKRCGADVSRVRKMMRNDFDAYTAKAEAGRSVELYREDYAIAAFSGENMASPTIVAAQVANELLDIVGIKASFVLTRFQEKIFISARAIDEVNVQIIMERLGGGGHLNAAGAQLVGMSLEEATEVVKNTLDEMLQKGDI